MAPPVDPSRMAAMMKNPWLPDIIEKDIQLLKLNKRKKEEEEWVTSLPSPCFLLRSMSRNHDAGN